MRFKLQISTQQIQQVAACVVLSLTLTACPAKQKNSPRPILRTIIMGDPKKIIEGVKLNPEIPDGFFVSNKKVYLFSAVEFVQKKEKVKEAERDLEKEEEAATSDEEATASPRFYPVQVVKSEPHIKLSFENSVLKINTANFSVELSDNAGSAASKAQLLHTSLSADQNILSLLIFGDDKTDGQSVFAIYLAKTFQPKKAEQISKDYFYILGPGQHVRWNKDNSLYPKKHSVQLDLCGSKPLKHENLIEAQARKWNDALEGQMQFATNKVTEFGPFSDLNQHCLYIIDDFITEPDMRYANYGLTANIVDYNKSQFLDGDIMLFTKEFGKTGVAYDSVPLAEELLITILHEMGHFLGLDHQFTGVKSIMSYDFDTTQLTDYDHKAIRELYRF